MGNWGWELGSYRAGWDRGEGLLVLLINSFWALFVTRREGVSSTEISLFLGCECWLSDWIHVFNCQIEFTFSINFLSFSLLFLIVIAANLHQILCIFLVLYIYLLRGPLFFFPPLFFQTSDFFEVVFWCLHCISFSKEELLNQKCIQL